MAKRKFYEIEPYASTRTMTDPAEHSSDSETKVSKRENSESVVHQLTDMVHLPGPEFKDSLRNPELRAHPPSSHELEELDHTIVNVAYQIEQLLSKFQWMQDLDLDEIATDPQTDQLVRSLVQKYRVRLAALLVKQYWQGGLPVLDNLLYIRHGAHLQTSIPQVQGGELTSSHMDELQALLLQAAVDTIKLTKQRINGDNAVLERSQNVVYDLKKMVKNKKKNNSQKSGDNSSESPNSGEWPPALPEIGNDAIAKQVFTHKSAIVDSNMASRSDIIHTHNERLEFKGDSILDFIVCDMLFTEFPNDSEGSMSIKKASLVCNDTLFDLSVTYKLHERLQISKDLRDKIYGPTKRTTPDPLNKNKAIADVFEAYIAGVALDKGLIAVQRWLKKLYEPLITDMRGQTTAVEVDKNAKNELYRKVGSANQRIEYIATVSEPNADSHTVKCIIDGEEVSEGTDRTVKLAGLRAAMAALKQPGLVEKFASKRRETPRTAPVTGSSMLQ